MRSLLVVDDDDFVRRMFEDYFSRNQARYNVTIATSVAEAIAILDENPHDIVLTDLDMPGANGVELLRYLEANHPTTVRAMMSGGADAPAARIPSELVDGLFARFFPKPFHPREFVGWLDLHLGPQQAVQDLY